MSCYIRGLKTRQAHLPVGLNKILSSSCEGQLTCEVSHALNENEAMMSLCGVVT